MQFKDYYEVLGVAPTADEAEIRKAYRRLARKYHPDVSKEADAEERFKAVNEAHEVLGDAEKRRAYDELRAGGFRAGEEFRPPPGWNRGGDFEFGSDTGGFSDFFESLFGGGARQRPRARAAPSRARLDIDLETAHTGGTRRIEVDGRTLDVKIPAGVAPGQQIRLARQGGGGRDLMLEIGYLPHRHFQVEGRDVVYHLALLPWEAALGVERDVPTLAGTVSLRVPAGSDSGRRLRLRGRGLAGAPVGDQYVVIDVRVPAAASEEQRAAWRRLAELHRSA